MHAAGGNEGMKKEIAEAKICWSHQNVCQVTHTDRGWLIKEELPVQKKDEKNLTKISGVISKGGIIEHCTAFLHAPACWLLLQKKSFACLRACGEMKTKISAIICMDRSMGKLAPSRPKMRTVQSHRVLFSLPRPTPFYTLIYLYVCMFACLSSGNL